MKLKCLAIIFTGLSLMATNTQAADLVRQRPLLFYDWNGLYIGIGAGVARTVFKKEDDTKDSKNYREYIPLGVYFGHNAIVDSRLMFGFDIEASFNLLRVISDADKVFLTDAANINNLINGTARVRAGIALNRFLPYIAVGGIVSKFERVEKKDDKKNTVNSEIFGMTLGAGIDYAMSRNFIIRIEYRHNKYNAEIFNQLNDPEKKIKEKATANEIRLGVIFKYN